MKTADATCEEALERMPSCNCSLYTLKSDVSKRILCSVLKAKTMSSTCFIKVYIN